MLLQMMKMLCIYFDMEELCQSRFSTLFFCLLLLDHRSITYFYYSTLVHYYFQSFCAIFSHNFAVLQFNGTLKYQVNFIENHF